MTARDTRREWFLHGQKVGPSSGTRGPSFFFFFFFFFFSLFFEIFEKFRSCTRSFPTQRWTKH